MNDFFNTVPPSDKDLEKAALWSIITNPRLLEKAKELNLSAESFYVTNHAATFTAICEIESRGEPIDLNTVNAQMKDGSHKVDIREFMTIAGADLGITNATRFETQCRRLKRYQHTRKMINAMRDSLMRLYVDKDYEKEMVTMETIFSMIQGESTTLKMRDIHEVKADFIRELEYKMAANEERGIVGIPFGVKEVDRMLNGWQAPRLYILAARPGMGKTEVAVKAMLSAAQAGYKTGFISVEMTDTGIFRRAMSQYTGMYKQDFEKGTEALKQRFDFVKQKAEEMANSGIMIDESCPQNYKELIAKCAGLVRKGAQFVVIDYLGLIGSDNKNENKALGEITRSLKTKVCKEIGVPVLLLHQLSRAVETRGGDKRPILSDLRGSGEIEQDADTVIFLYRPEYYGFETDEEGSSTQGLMEYIFAKNRNEATGIVKSQYIASIGTISDWGPGSSPASSMMPGMSSANGQHFGAW